MQHLSKFQFKVLQFQSVEMPQSELIHICGRHLIARKREHADTCSPQLTADSHGPSAGSDFLVHILVLNMSADRPLPSVLSAEHAAQLQGADHTRILQCCLKGYEVG